MFCCFSGCIQGKRWCQQDNKEAGSPPSHCEEHIRPSFLMLQFPSSMFSKNGLTSGRGSFHPGAHLTSPFAQTMRKYNCYLKAKRVRPKQLKHVMEWLSNKDMYCYSFCYIFIYTGWSLAHKDKHTKYQGITQPTYHWLTSLKGSRFSATAKIASRRRETATPAEEVTILHHMHNQI